MYLAVMSVSLSLSYALSVSLHLIHDLLFYFNMCFVTLLLGAEGGSSHSHA